MTSIDAELHTPATARLYDCFESDRDGVETNFMNNELCVAHGMMDFDACLWADPNDTDGSEGTTGCIEFGVVKCWWSDDGHIEDKDAVHDPEEKERFLLSMTHAALNSIG